MRVQNESDSGMFTVYLFSSRTDCGALIVQACDDQLAAAKSGEFRGHWISGLLCAAAALDPNMITLMRSVRCCANSINPQRLVEKPARKGERNRRPHPVQGVQRISRACEGGGARKLRGNHPRQRGCVNVLQPTDAVNCTVQIELTITVEHCGYLRCACFNAAM